MSEVPSIDVLDAAGATRTVATATALATLQGAVTETAPATDTASSGLNGRLQRIAQRVTSLIGLLPTALGSAAASASLAVTQSTEDIARVGIVTETAPATDTASSGLNGRLQRIAQRLTTIIAGLAVTAADGTNVTLGAKADAKSAATDTTSITIMQVLKQVSASIQAAAASLAGTLTVASHAVTNAGTFAVQAAGDTAAAATDAGNPVKIGGVGKTANPTAVTDGQRVNALFDKLGKQIVVGAIRDLKGVTQTQISNSTSETTIVAAVASTFCDLYGLILANTGATTTKVTIKDATAGTTRAIIEVPTLETRGFMLPVDSAVPQAVVNNNWTATCASATTALEVTALFVKNT